MVASGSTSEPGVPAGGRFAKGRADRAARQRREAKTGVPKKGPGLNKRRR